MWHNDKFQIVSIVVLSHTFQFYEYEQEKLCPKFGYTGSKFETRCLWELHTVVQGLKWYILKIKKNYRLLDAQITFLDCCMPFCPFFSDNLSWNSCLQKIYTNNKLNVCSFGMCWLWTEATGNGWICLTFKQT